MITPQTGDILCVMNGNWWLAKRIRRITRSDVHHVGILFYDYDGRLKVSEMERQGHVITDWADPKYNFGKPHDRHLIIQRLYGGHPDPDLLRDMILNHKAPYDFASLPQQVIWNVFGIWLGKRGEEAKLRMTCSEWVAYAYHQHTDLFRRWWKKTPRDIMMLHKERFDFYPTR
jgi:hypothetical protein